MKRPTGILVLGILLLAISSFSFLSILINILYFTLWPNVVLTAMQQANIPIEYSIISLIYSLAVVVLSLTLAIGLLKLKEWARQGFVYLYSVGLVIGFLNIFVSFYLGITGKVLSAIIWLFIAPAYCGIIYYLTRKKIKKVFS